jgi:ElaB/YqjD/DUF883 family membrane-anchored ribosome-binding protein
MENTARNDTPTPSGMSTNSEGAVNKVSSSVHAAVDSIAEAADVAVRKARPAIDRVAARAHHAVDKAAGAAAPTADWLTEQGENLAATHRRLVADTSSYISANPLKAVGFAVIAGFLLGRIWIGRGER